MTTLARRRRNAELALGLIAVTVTIGGYVLLSLADGPDLPPDLAAFAAWVVGLYAIAHVAVRRFAPRADGTLLPLVAFLNGLGFVTVTRLDPELGRSQSLWTTVGVGAFVLTLVVVRDVGVLERFRYSFGLLGILLLLLPLSPFGQTINGARLWFRVGPFNVQPGEAAKVLLTVFVAAYLVEKRELLTAGTRRLGRLHIPDLKHLGPMLLAWGVSIGIMVVQTDLGTPLLFFLVFTALVYVATNRAAYVVGALGLFAAGAVFAHSQFVHVQTRVTTWLDPWPLAQAQGFQVTQSWFSFGTGGLAGTGLGRGNPDKIPFAATDFIFAAIGEELGLLGSLAVIIAFLLLVGTGMRIAVDAIRPFDTMLAAGLSALVGIQAFIIIAGVTRLIPLTGITLPFVSYGGSSLVTNFVIVALLLRVSDDTVRRRARERVAAGAAP